jgi:23S rRNA pseudouridine1911/1915/1917 synthase
LIPFTLQWTIEKKDEKKLIREFLKIHDISKAALTDIKFNGGSIMINNEPVTVRYMLKEGDLLTVSFPIEYPSLELKPENLRIEIIYEDDYLLIVNKPPYMSTIPSREHPSGSLANGLLYYYKEIGLASTIHIVNRLDRDTSGLLAVAKHRHIHHLFSKQQKTGTIKRRYAAIVEGILKAGDGIISEPIGRKDSSIIEREVRSDGQRAVTHYRVIERKDNLTYLFLQLETGRTHQIRVHLSHLGHPLVGDSLYGGVKTDIDRQALHCFELSFMHPILKTKCYFNSKIPEDMQQLL